MRGSGRSGTGWRGIALIVAIYVYFLIFAQFAFLARLAELQIGANSLKIVMATMAVGGILFSLLTPRIRSIASPAQRLRIGLAISATAALLTLLPLGIIAAGLVALLIGVGLGISTVTLVTHLREWTGGHRGVLKVGLGTGIAYFTCNIPAVFTATPQVQAVLAAVLCAIAIAFPLAATNESTVAENAPPRISFAVALIAFSALIWLDSAAFYIIQHTPILKAGTWMGSTHLWLNGTLHFIAAITAATLLQRGRSGAALALAYTALAFACILLQHPALTPSASLFYPVGVSLYSVALVAYPSFLAGASSTADRGRQAGWIYAIAGWIGSALGIGMGQNLGHVPLAFVGLAGVAVLGPVSISAVKQRPRELALIAAVGVLAFVVYRLVPQEKRTSGLTPAQRGRQVYISEGCISCHSQYVRPNSPDVLMWGPIESVEELHAQKPPLIGNRRQGPDLSEVGFRRSPLWLQAHLVDPAQLSYHSPMPSFAFLFRDARGSDLVAYLCSLHGPGEQQQLQRESTWSPSSSALQAANLHEGGLVYQQHCATCHDPKGATRMQWFNAWHKIPPTLSELRVSAGPRPQSELAHISKFGIVGTDMPGHEYLNDQQIASVALWLKTSPTQDTDKPYLNDRRP
jgi:cytochrome c oxidase cbb3-type subunit 2